MDEQNPSNPESAPVVPPATPQPEAQPTPQPQPTQRPPQPAPTAATTPKHNTLMAVVAYILFFIPLLTEAKNDPFVKFHVKQGLILFIACLAAGAIMQMPVIGWMLIIPLKIFLFILWVIGILNALGGKQKHLPLIGQYGDQFQF